MDKPSISQAFHRDMAHAIGVVAARYNMNAGGVGIAHQPGGMIVICRLSGDDTPPAQPKD